MVTPEMLLFLARKVEKYPASILDSVVWLAYPLDTWMQYRPHTDDAQFGRLVVWAAMHGMGPTIEDTYCSAFDDQVEQYKVAHDATPDSIRAAAVVAICRALGWEGEA